MSVNHLSDGGNIHHFTDINQSTYKIIYAGGCWSAPQDIPVIKSLFWVKITVLPHPFLWDGTFGVYHYQWQAFFASGLHHRLDKIIEQYPLP
jgi:hypothetical protein